MERASVHKAKPAPSATGSAPSWLAGTQRSGVIQRHSNGQSQIPPIVHEVLRSSGQALDAATRAYMEPRFGHDFSKVRVHADGKAAEAAGSINATAFTSGRSIAFGSGKYAPKTSAGVHLLAHELAHFVQQRAPAYRIADSRANENEEHRAEALARRAIAGRPVADRLINFSLSNGISIGDGGAPTIQRWEGDAGVPESLPGGVPDALNDGAPEKLNDYELGPEYEIATANGDSARAEAIDQEMEKRLVILPMAATRGPAPLTGATGMVTPEIALELLNNMAKGEPPFKPELGLGGCSWFTTEGNPYTSVKPNQTVPVQVQIAKGSNPLVLREADLIKIFDSEAGDAAVQAEAQVRAQYKISAVTKLTNRILKTIRYRLPGTQEKLMWTKVGEKIAASSQKIGEIVLEPGSRFSDTPGKFAAIADASKITLKGGTAPLVEALSKQGVTAEPVVVEAAEVLAKRMKWAGRVRNAFRYGGRIMIVVAIAADVVKIYYARDKVKAVIESAGGWAGATLAAAAFGAWFAPADVAGPWAWAAHGVGTLVAGGVGYFVGSETTRTIYELVAE